MDLLDLLPPEHLVVPLEAPDLHTAIVRRAARLEETGVVQELAPLEKRIRDQHARDVVEIADGVVLPHYRSDAVQTLGLALGIARDPIPVPDRPELAPRVIALIVAPPEAATLYLQTNSTLARVFRQPDTLAELVRQPDAGSVRAMPQLRGLRIQHSLVVRDIMTHRIQSVPPDHTVRRTLDIMLRRRLRAVPVVGDKGEVMGMVTDADIMRALLPKMPRAGEEEPEGDDEPQDRPVREIMTRSVLCVSEDLGVGEVASMMINKDVEQVPVVSAGSITGMVYRGDIIRKLFGRA